MPTRIDPKTVAILQPGEMISDTVVQGLRARAWESGAVTFDFRYRTKDGQRRSIPIGRHGDLTIEQARTLAKKRAWEVANEKDPAKERKVERATSSNTVAAVWDEYVKRKLSKMRSAKEQTSSFDRLVRPAIGNRPIYDLKRSDMKKLFDDIEDDHGVVMSDRMLAYLGRCFRLQMVGDDDFTSPIVAGMARTSAKSLARKRILTDDEIRAIWKATEQGVFGALVRFLLLTAARRSEAAEMPWSELFGTTWVLLAARNKTKHDDLARPLSKDAMAILTALNRGSAATVFTIDDDKPITGFSYHKSLLDKASGVTGWRIHDLRRTARSLMSRAGVSKDHAEICLGHVQPVIVETYDQYEYDDEKRAAFEALAKLVRSIVPPR